MVTVSAPGKVHLMGEHAIVYGKPALLTAVDLRLTCSISEGTDSLAINADESPEYVISAIDEVKKHFNLNKLPPMELTITSKIPIGFHLGSSAATAVATVGAAIYFLKKIWNPQLTNQIAYKVEKKKHGNPSGGDNTAVTFGGLLWYRKELEFLKSMWQLSFKIPVALNHFFLVNTGRPKETTGEMVAYVKSKIKNQKSKLESLFDKNEEQTKRVAKAMKEENEKELIDAIQLGERTLEGMGVVSKKIVPLIRSIEKIGGAAKILGGGGRSDGVGFVLCYHHNPKTIESLGWKIQSIRLAGEGVRLEKKA